MLFIGKNVIIKVLYDGYNFKSPIQDQQNYILIENKKVGDCENISNELNRIITNSNVQRKHIVNFNTGRKTLGYNTVEFDSGTSSDILSTSFGLYITLEHLKKIELLYYIIYKNFPGISFKYNKHFNPSETVKEQIERFMKERWYQK